MRYPLVFKLVCALLLSSSPLALVAVANADDAEPAGLIQTDTVQASTVADNAQSTRPEATADAAEAAVTIYTAAQADDAADADDDAAGGRQRGRRAARSGRTSRRRQ